MRDVVNDLWFLGYRKVEGVTKPNGVCSRSDDAYGFFCWCPSKAACFSMTSSMRNKSKGRRKLHRRTRAYWLVTTSDLASLGCAGYDEWC